MNHIVKINRLATGVPGLDDVLGGGLPEFSFNLIAGTPGSGKTTLAHQIMFALATPERPAIYFTVLGEPPLKMLRYQQQFAFFDPERINDSIRFINLSDDAIEGGLDKVLTRIVTEVKAFEPGLVFVDSFRSVIQGTGAKGTAHANVQKFMQELGMVMTSWQATTFLIWLRQSVQRNSMVRKMEVMKMRGQSLLPGLHSFRISDDGIQIFAPACAVADRIDTPDLNPARLGMGVPELDAMMGGGLPRGYSLLIAGPSGSGKSLMANAFLAEGARQGEKGVVATFEQRPHRSRNVELAELIDAGQVALVDTRAPDLSIDELLLILLNAVRRLDATRVVIDSLSGFELALAPTFRTDFRESMLRLVTGLTGAGVSVLMTSELEDRYTDLRFSPYGTAFLTDAIIVQRYIEVESRLRRVMAVVKVRASNHSDELREYTIDGDGLRIGAMLPDQEGLLGGRPTRKKLKPPRDSDD